MYSRRRRETRRRADIQRYWPEYECCYYSIPKACAREKRIPFELTADPFYSASNMEHIRRGVEALDAGKGVEHELIEVD